MSAATLATLADDIHGGNTQSTTAVGEDEDYDLFVYTQSSLTDGARQTIQDRIDEEYANDDDINPSVYSVGMSAGTRTGKHAEMVLWHAFGAHLDPYGASQTVCARCAAFLDGEGKDYAPAGGHNTAQWWNPRLGSTVSAGATHPTADSSATQTWNGLWALDDDEMSDED